MTQAHAFDVTAPMEARSSAALPEATNWWFEPKWDGFRCLALRQGDEVRLQAKSGKPLDGAVSPTRTCLHKGAEPPTPLEHYAMRDCHSAMAAERRAL
jgi:ATP-dependent DNA ligase